MGGPAWLTDIFAAVMITVAAYCASRLVVARWRRRPTDVDSDGMHVVMGVAMAGMLVTGLRFGSAGIWEAVFAAAAAWFGWRFVRVRRGAPLSQWRCPQPVPHLVECGAMLYMYLALPAVAVSGQGAVVGMAATGARFSFLALVLALFMFGYVVRVGDRLTAQAPALAVARSASPGGMTAANRLAGGPDQPGERAPGPPVRRDVQDRHGHHHGLHADPDALTRELVSGFFDGLTQRGVGGQRLAGDPHPPRGHVDVDVGHTRELADLGLDGMGAVVAAHAGDHDGASFHDRDHSPPGRPGRRRAAAVPYSHDGYRRP